MEDNLRATVNYLVLFIEAVGATVIVGTVILSVAPLVRGVWPGQPPLNLSLVRQRLGRGLVLALEFLIAADILRTLLSPGLVEVGILAVIVILRTILTFSLDYELRQIESPDRGT